MALVGQVYKTLLAGLVSLSVAFFPLQAYGQATTGGDAPIGGVSTANELSSRSVSLKMQMLGPQRGLLTNKADVLRQGEYAAVLDNLHMLKDGVWSSRGTGWTKKRASVFNSGAQFYGFGLHTDSSNADHFVFDVGSKLYDYNLSTDTETAIFTNGGAIQDVCITSYDQTHMYYANGIETPQYWSGSGSTASVTAFPATVGSFTWNKPLYCERFLDRICFARFAQQSAGTPIIAYQMVLFSTSGGGATSPFGFGTSSPAAATDGGYISFASRYGFVSGMRRYRLRDSSNTEVLLVGMDRALCCVTGTNALSFTGSVISDEFGVLSNHTWVQVGDDLYFLATDGIRRLRSVSGDGGAPVPELVTTGIQDVMNRINSSVAYKSWAMYNPKTQEIVFWVPIDSDTTPQNAIVLNLQQDRSAPVFSTLSQQKLTAGIYYNGVAYGGTSDGYLEKLWTGDDFDGTVIAWEYLSAISGASSPAQNASNRKFQIITDGSNQQFTAQAYTLTQRGDGVTQLKLQASKSIAVTKPSITKLGTWASGTTTSYTQFTDFASPGSGRYWLCRLTGSASGDHIDLVGVLDVLQVGGLKQ